MTSLLDLQGVAADVAKSVPDIIKSASGSPLGILALLIIGLAGLAYVFFKDAKEKLRTGIFIMLFVGVVLYGWAIVGHLPIAAGPPPKQNAVASPSPVIGGVIVDRVTNAAVKQAEITIVGSTDRAISDDDGNFTLTIGNRAYNDTSPVTVRIVREGYNVRDWQVVPPSQHLDIPLERVH
jgi:hypothetical protein